MTTTPVIVNFPFVALFSILSIVGIVGNLIVILAIAGDKNMRKSVMNILLLNLAVADLANLIFTIPEWIAPVFFNNSDWLLPSWLCPICRYLECVFLFASISTQMIVCVERYIAIVLPMQARHLCTRWNALLAVFVAWIFVACFASPYAVWHSVKTTTCSNQAVKSDWWQKYKLVEFLAFYLVPCILIISVYTIIARALWSKDPQLDGETRLCMDKMKSNGMVAAAVAAVNNRGSDTLRTRRNVVKMLTACVAVYFVCYSPIQIIFLSKAAFNVTIHPPYEFILLMNALAMTCSASNPLLYTLFSTKFRQRLRDVLYCNSSSEQKNVNARKNYISINNSSVTATRASFN